MSGIKLVNIAHVLVTGPFFIYIGLAQPSHVGWYRVCLGLGAVLALLFAWKLWSTAWSQYHIWLLIHLLLFAGLLVAVGVQKKQTPQILFSIMIAVGCAAIGYHLIRLVQHMRFT